MLNTVVELSLLQVKEVSFMEMQSQQPPSTACPKELEVLKLQFLDFFANPDSLPPHRGVFDYTIPLEPGERPVNVRPYRFPPETKGYIEQLVNELLKRGIIQIVQMLLPH